MVHWPGKGSSGCSPLKFCLFENLFKSTKTDGEWQKMKILSKMISFHGILRPLTLFRCTFRVIFADFGPIWPDIEQVILGTGGWFWLETFTQWPNNSKTHHIKVYIRIGEGCPLNFFQITFSPILVNLSPIWPDLKQPWGPPPDPTEFFKCHILSK